LSITTIENTQPAGAGAVVVSPSPRLLSSGFAGGVDFAQAAATKSKLTRRIAVVYDEAVPTPEKFGSYLVYEQLGVGGMASVHVAELRGPGGFRKRVALKRLLDHASADEALVGLFTDEARLAQYLHHPNIAQTFDVGCVDGTYYIAMELVPGPTVRQLLRQCKSTIGVIPFPITLSILCQLLDALEYAHNVTDKQGNPLGIIHRDVTPPNVVISNSGIVKLIDFGLAKAKSAQQTTTVGTIKGKFSYIAPEYLGGRLDSRCDLWSVGALAHELLTSRTLFEGDDDFDVLERVKTMAIHPPSSHNKDVPPELDAIVLTALERDTARRWQSAQAMRNALVNAASELQTIVTNAQLAQWVEWAFSQVPPGENSELSQLIQILDVPSRPRARSAAAFDRGTPPPQPVVPVKVEPLPPASRATATSAMIQPMRDGAATGRAGGGTYAAYYYGLLDGMR
jgi:eukaryotic-like serine/threonine-protein kinase